MSVKARAELIISALLQRVMVKTGAPVSPTLSQSQKGNVHRRKLRESRMVSSYKTRILVSGVRYAQDNLCMKTCVYFNVQMCADAFGTV